MIHMTKYLYRQHPVCMVKNQHLSAHIRLPFSKADMKPCASAWYSCHDYNLPAIKFINGECT